MYFDIVDRFESLLQLFFDLSLRLLDDLVSNSVVSQALSALLSKRLDHAKLLSHMLFNRVSDVLCFIVQRLFHFVKNGRSLCIHSRQWVLLNYRDLLCLSLLMHLDEERIDSAWLHILGDLPFVCHLQLIQLAWFCAQEVIDSLLELL